MQQGPATRTIGTHSVFIIAGQGGSQTGAGGGHMSHAADAAEIVSTVNTAKDAKVFIFFLLRVFSVSYFFSYCYSTTVNIN